MLSYKLRPHHALCLSFFEGKGYSSDFIHNMSRIYNTLQDEDEIQITLGKDDICHKCPNMHHELCTSQSKVQRYDELVAALCEFEEGQALAYGDFLNRAYKQIIAKEELGKICSDCGWFKVCEAKSIEKKDVNK